MSKARLEISAEDKFSATLNRAKSQFSGLQSSLGGIKSLASSVTGSFAALGATFITGGIVGAIRSVAQSFDDLNNAAQAAGVGVVALSELRTTAEFAGVGAAKLDDALTKLNVKIAEAAGGNQQAIQIFEALGVSIRDAAGNVRGTEDVLSDVADRFSSFRDGASKSAIAVKLFSETGAKLIPLLNQGSDSLRTFSGLTEQTAEEAVKLQSEFNKLSVTFTTFKNSVLSVAVPALNNLFDVVRRLSSNDIGDLVSFNPVRLARGLATVARVTDEVKNYNAELEKSLRLSSSPLLDLNRALKPEAPILEKDAVTSAEKISQSAKALEQYDAQLKAQIASVQQLTSVEQTLQFLRDNKDIDTPDVRARLLAQAELVDGLKAESEMREEIGRITKRQIEEQTKLRDQVFELAGVYEEQRRRALTEMLGQLKKEGALTQEQAERAAKGIANVKDAVKDTNTVANDLGLTFSSAFEDAIVSGRKFSDILKGLHQDILRLFIRKTFTERFTNFFGDLFGVASGTTGNTPTGSVGVGAGDLIPSYGVSLASSGRAGGNITIINQVEHVGSNVSRADMLAAMEQTRAATIGQIADLNARGRLKLA